MPPETLHVNWLQGQLTVQKNRAETGQEVWTSPEKISSKDDLLEAVSYTHLTLPTNREV